MKKNKFKIWNSIRFELIVGNLLKNNSEAIKKHVLEYDQNILPSTSLIWQLQLDYKKHEFNPNTVVEANANFSFSDPPSESDNE